MILRQTYGFFDSWFTLLNREKSIRKATSGMIPRFPKIAGWFEENDASHNPTNQQWLESPTRNDDSTKLQSYGGLCDSWGSVLNMKNRLEVMIFTLHLCTFLGPWCEDCKKNSLKQQSTFKFQRFAQELSHNFSQNHWT